jgi:hypothetical protein
MKYYNRHTQKLPLLAKVRKKLQGTKDTRNYSIIYSGVKHNIRAQSGVMLPIHKHWLKRLIITSIWMTLL